MPVSSTKPASKPSIVLNHCLFSAIFLIDGDGVIRGIWRKFKVLGYVEAVFKAVKGL
jgi:peroxiredoxin